MVRCNRPADIRNLSARLIAGAGPGEASVITMQIRRTILLLVALSGPSLLAAQTFDLEQEMRALQQRSESGVEQDYRVAQDNGMSLSEAIESVRRKTNGRIVSAETKVSGGRETHHIKVLTKDGKVKTHKVKGRKRGSG